MTDREPAAALPGIERPDIIIPDTGPLIHLAQAYCLGATNPFGWN
jgi:hypothetical protein